MNWLLHDHNAFQRKDMNSKGNTYLLSSNLFTFLQNSQLNIEQILIDLDQLFLN